MDPNQQRGIRPRQRPRPRQPIPLPGSLPDPAAVLPFRLDQPFVAPLPHPPGPARSRRPALSALPDRHHLRPGVPGER
ncbi:MAG TPA: hypothetical protein ENI39_08135 [Anaerolineae bacterium]|nr:hypothetical protein [Anaerolineae bacterium]